MVEFTLTHEARCLVILAGGVLERCIENRAREIAESRSDVQITPEDVQKATAEILKKGLCNLPPLIEQAFEVRSKDLTNAA